MDKPIFLIGPSGIGKTALGSRACELLAGLGLGPAVAGRAQRSFRTVSCPTAGDLCIAAVGGADPKPPQRPRNGRSGAQVIKHSVLSNAA